MEDGGAAEVKLGSSQIELKNGVSGMEPSFMMIVTGTEYGYKSDDGIYVVPIGCLKD